MKLYYFASCRFCQRVLTVIDELNIRSHIEFLDIHEQPEHAEALEKLNGTRQVP